MKKGASTEYVYQQITADEGFGVSSIGDFWSGWVAMRYRNAGSLAKNDFWDGDGCYTFEVSIQNTLGEDVNGSSSDQIFLRSKTRQVHQTNQHLQKIAEYLHHWTNNNCLYHDRRCNIMVNFSLDEDSSLVNRPVSRRRSSSLKIERDELRSRTPRRKLSSGRVKKIINGEVVYLRVKELYVSNHSIILHLHRGFQLLLRYLSGVLFHSYFGSSSTK